MMLKKYEGVCYELLRPAQVRDIRERSPIAYIVTGALEWHGHQNPLGCDSLKAHAVCCEAALRGLAVGDRLSIDGPEGMSGPNPLTHASAEMGRKIIEGMGLLIGARAIGMLSGP